MTIHIEPPLRQTVTIPSIRRAYDRATILKFG
jgi:hypothetical protein